MRLIIEVLAKGCHILLVEVARMPEELVALLPNSQVIFSCKEPPNSSQIFSDSFGKKIKR